MVILIHNPEGYFQQGISSEDLYVDLQDFSNYDIYNIIRIISVLAFCVITQYAIYKISPKVVYVLTGKR